MLLRVDRARWFRKDVKLALALGALLSRYGWLVLLLGVFAGYLVAAGWAIVLLIRGRATARTAIPFGPALLTGSLIGVLLAPLLT